MRWSDEPTEVEVEVPDERILEMIPLPSQWAKSGLRSSMALG